MLNFAFEEPAKNMQNLANLQPLLSRPVPPSSSLWAPGPRNRTEREALAERFSSAFCDKAQGSDNGCLLWHLNMFALTWSQARYPK